MAYTKLILAVSSARSRWLFPVSVLSFCPNCWWWSWASQHLVRPLTPRLLMNAPKAGCMTCAKHGMWFLNVGHTMPEASRVVHNLPVFEKFEVVLSAVIPSKRLSVSSKRSRTSFKCPASCTPVCWQLICNPWWVFETGKNGLSISLNARCTSHNAEFRYM